MKTRDSALLRLLAQTFVRELDDVARQNRCLDELSNVARALDDEPELRRVLTASALRPLERQQLIWDALHGELDELTLRYVLFLLEWRKLHLLPQLVRRIEGVRLRKKLIWDVTVTSAEVLDDDERKKLEHSLSRQRGLPIRLTERTDPSLIGGLRLTAGSWIYDDSIRGRLDRLTTSLTTSSHL